MPPDRHGCTRENGCLRFHTDPPVIELWHYKSYASSKITSTCIDVKLFLKSSGKKTSDGRRGSRYYLNKTIFFVSEYPSRVRR